MKIHYDPLTNSAGYEEGEKSVALSPNPPEGLGTQALILVGRPIKGIHLDSGFS
jgi:hypothetical protein